MLMVQGTGEVTNMVETGLWGWQNTENTPCGHRAAEIVSTGTKGQEDSHHLGLFLSKITQLIYWGTLSLLIHPFPRFHKKKCR